MKNSICCPPPTDNEILETFVDKRGGLTFYNFHCYPFYLVSMTATRNRLFIMTTACNARQWKKYEADFRKMQKSFQVASTDL